jgi:VWFA-related protein
MSKAIFFGLLILLTSSPAFAARKVTVEQLSREIASSAKKKDAKMAGRLYELQLTERLNAQKLAAFEAALPGPESRRALVALSDQAEFLDPPAAEIPNQPAPSIDQQRAIIARAVDYAAATLHRLPDLFAREDTIRYEDSPPGLQVANSQSASGTFVPYQPLHPVSRSVATVLYRDGQEVVQTGAEARGASASGLTTSGEFGSIFSVVFGDLPKGKLEWGQWENGATGLVAVFRFAVPEAASHYQVKFCCVAGSVFQQFSAYHGELTLDPSTGTILRLTLIADLGRGKPISEAELMVEYGPKDLGAKTYFCPVRSVSVTLAPMQGTVQGGGPVNLNQSPMYMRGAPTVVNNNGGGGSDVPLQTMLNEVAFDEYHLFRADVQILTAGNTPPGPRPNASATADANSAAPSATASNMQPPAEVQSSTPAATNNIGPSTASTPANASPPAPTAPAIAPPAPLPANSNAPAAIPAVSSLTTRPAPKSDQEIALASPAPLADNSTTPSQTSTNTAFSLRLNARLVDIGVTAYDRKGQPVTNLTADDFVIYDDGRKVNVRSFSDAGRLPASTPTSAATPQPVLFSNRLDAMGSSESNNSQPAGSSTVLLLDPTNLDFADLTHAREQVLKFLDRLPASEPVGLYVRNNFGFQILAEETTDHSAISSALRKWMPSAPDLARAQEEERRNRQEFDTVHSPDDMQNVNGNIGGMITPDTAPPTSSAMGTNMNIPGGGSGTTSDPKLMREGSNPGREALIALVAVAAHMNAIPGHKDLVWIASDNVLANWTDQAPGTDKGPNTIDRFTLGAQEALNNAHVSLYPLDASQLETAATDASLQNNSVQVNSATPNPTNVGGVDQMEGGRAQAAMRQDIRAVQPAMQQMAQSTGGRVFGRSDDIVRDLNAVIDDGHASYLLSFAPDTAPDGKYHKLTVTVPTRRGVTLRYRAGYLYTKEPSSLKDRFKQAVWQPQDETEIGLNAHWDHASQGAAISLNIAATDLSLTQQGDRWQDRVDVFLVQRDVTGTHADVKEQTLVLNMKPDTYQKVLRDGVPFADYIEQKSGTGTVRVIVVDEDSQRIGSVTLPVPMQQASR